MNKLFQYCFLKREIIRYKFQRKYEWKIHCLQEAPQKYPFAGFGYIIDAV